MLEMGRRGEGRRGDGEVSCGDFFLFSSFLSSFPFFFSSLFFFFSVLLNMRLTALPARVNQVKQKNPSPT